MDERAAARAVRKNEPYLDVLRCLACYLVIGLHSIAEPLVNKGLFDTRTWWVLNICGGLTRMGVPLFFMISGYLLLSDPRTLDIGTFYKRRLGKLLPPFLVWDVIYFLKQCADGGVEPDVQTFFRDLAFQGSKYHLWFVYQIIGLYLLMPFLKRIVDQCTTRELVIFLGVVLLQPTLFRLLNLVQTVVWLNIFSTLVEGYAGFLITGYLLGSRELSRTARWWIYGLGLVGLVGGAWGNYVFSSPDHIDLVFNEGYSITHFLTSGACFVLAKQLTGKLPQRLLRGTKKVSHLTYGIYLSHVLLLDLILQNRWYIMPNQTPAGFTVFSFVVTSLVSTVFVWLVSHVRGLRKLLM